MSQPPGPPPPSEPDGEPVEGVDDAAGTSPAPDEEHPTAPYAQQPPAGGSGPSPDRPPAGPPAPGGASYGPPQYGQYGAPQYGDQPQYGGQYQPGGAPFGQPGYGGGAYAYPLYPGVPATNGKATAALITGLVTLVLSWCCGAGLLGLVAVVLGVKARSEIRMSGGRQDGEGMALAGIITGAVAALIGLVALVIIVVAIATSPDFGNSGVYEGY